MGLLHHANYLVYFEMGRTELLRPLGKSYLEMEESGFYLVLHKVEVKYRAPARYDDLLTLKTKVSRITPVRIEHEYLLYRDHDLLATGSTTLACVDRSGKLQPLPEWIMREHGDVSEEARS